MTILVTGGLGFIGSHTIVELVKQNYEDIIIIDNLINSKKNVLEKINLITNSNKIKFIELDILDKLNLEKVFENNKI